MWIRRKNCTRSLKPRIYRSRTSRTDIIPTDRLCRRYGTAFRATLCSICTSGEEYYEFNNGTELDTWHTGDTEWTFAVKGSEDYYSYSRAKRHYFADGELLLNDYPSAVRSAEVKNEVGGIKRVLIQYDDAKISQYEQMSGVTDYSQEYWTDNIFDSNVIVDNGQCYSLIVSYSKDGKKYSYYISIAFPDPSAPIERIEPPALSGEITETEQ